MIQIRERRKELARKGESNDAEKVDEQKDKIAEEVRRRVDAWAPSEDQPAVPSAVHRFYSKRTGTDLDELLSILISWCPTPFG